MNTRVKRLELHFDEYVVLGDASKEIEVSPLLSVPPTVTAVNKHVTVKIADTLLEDNTTYRISFGRAVKDLHEGNAFTGYTYTFSTGGYFDSLMLRGKVLNAATGFPDSSGTVVVLYAAGENDSAIVKKKPRYKTHPDNQGNFTFRGLPGKAFRIYAIKDENNNLTYDGDKEMVAFSDSLVRSVDTLYDQVTLRLFAEEPDTASLNKKGNESTGMKGKKRIGPVDSNLSYTVAVDTGNTSKRTFNPADSVKVVFTRDAMVNTGKVVVTYDSADRVVTLPAAVRKKANAEHGWYVSSTRWVENKVYTLRFADSFAVDTGNVYAKGGVYRFRTFNDDDLGKITLNVPGKYLSGATTDHVLLMKADNDTVYQQKITDTVVKLKRLKAGNYTFRIIVDKNRNGHWDTGDLLGKRQPELVIVSTTSVPLKAGFEHVVDFEQKQSAKSKMGPGADKKPLKK